MATDCSKDWDAGLALATVYIDANHNGTLDAGESSVKSSNTGGFSLTKLLPGTYSVARFRRLDIA